MFSSRSVLAFLDRSLKAIALASGMLTIAIAAVKVSDPFSFSTQNPMLVQNGETGAAISGSVNQEALPELRELPSELVRLPQVPSYHFPPLFDRDVVLNDMKRRIPDDFIIPPGLQNRVSFWFDIYSRYDSNKRVIHHTLYPWVVYKVVDVEPIISSDFPKFRWQRNQIAEALVKKEMAKVRLALKRLSGRKKSQLVDAKLSEEEVQVRDALAVLGGDVRRRAKESVHEVRMQVGQRNFFAEGLQTAPRYMAVMEEIFRQQKLPVELTRLPLVESSFNKHAKSKVGAAGVWQFMEGTGRKQKLIVNAWIDERKSVFKATEAAARLLKENHLILSRSWELAVTAWNHGPGGIKKASRVAGTKDLSRIIEVYHSRRFDFASENFFSEFLAALYADRYADMIFPGLPRQDAIQVQEIRLSRQIRIEDILRVTALSADDFISINPDIARMVQKNLRLFRGLRIHVPTDSRSAVEALLADRIIGAND